MQTQTVFKPAWWLNNPHLQTIYPALFRKKIVLKESWRERLVTPDNDFVDLDWCGKGCQPLVILLHGLTGSSESGYINGLQKKLLEQGYRSVALNFRGCSGESNNLARSYHSGDTEDIDFLYQTLREREPGIEMAVIGFSLGGNVLLKWLGEQGDKLTLFAAIAVSVPLVLSVCATRLDAGFSRFYRGNLIQELKDYMQTKLVHLQTMGHKEEAEKIYQLGDLSTIKSFWEYDDQVVARLHGFNNAEHYYQQSSSRYYLKSIKVPTLLIQSEDDPFMTNKVIPWQKELSSAIVMDVTQAGGHVGFVSGNNPFQPIFWLEQRIPEFLKQRLDQVRG